MADVNHRMGIVLVIGVLIGLACFAEAPAQPAGGETVVLDTSSFWRVHYTLKPPVARTAGAVETIEFPAKWIMRDSPPPDDGWTKPQFDDGGWPRFPGVVPGVSSIYGYPQSAARQGDPKVPFLAQECMRGKFTVTDPAKVAGLALSASWRGGLAVYLNGTEIVRDRLGAGNLDQLADDYTEGEARDRSLAGVRVPDGLLRKGTNVLAVEVRRSAYGPGDVKRDRKGNPEIDWGSCGLLSLRLTAAAGEGLVPGVRRPAGFQVWNSNPMQMDTDLDYGEAGEKLRPIHLVGTRNGAFSGKVVVGSDKPIKALQGRMSDLKHVGGKGVIPASAVQVRYAVADHYESCTNARYLAPVSCFDGLEEVAPAEVPVRVKPPNSRALNLTSPGVAPSFGAVQPVWVTVNVPADAASGAYEATLTLAADGETPVRVPVAIDVCGWKLPDPRDFITWVDIIQSPESVAMQYDVPIWSDEHFRYLGRSLRRLGEVGNKVVYLHLIARTNAGNEQTIVRWIPQADGTYAFDLAPLEKYLDLVKANGGKPSVVCLWVWDTYLEGGRGGAEQWAGEATKAARAAHGDKGPLVSVLDRAAGTVEAVALPMYSEPARSLPLWRALMKEIMKRLEQRGLEKAVMLGISTDNQPTKEVVDFFKEVLPGVPWVSQGHAMPVDLHGVPVKYLTGVWQGGKFPADPSEKRTYGWKRTFAGFRSQEFSSPAGAVLVHHPRNLWQVFPVTAYRLVGEMNIAGQQRGFARLGGDFWAVLKDRRGAAHDLSARYPETGWRNLDIRSRLLSPGVNGALSTQRLEMLREGIQECEARIFIERAILDGTIDGERAQRCQAVLDERIPAIRRGVSTLGCSAASCAYADNNWWQIPGMMGHYWYVGSAWQERSRKLYAAAAEVARALGEQ